MSTAAHTEALEARKGLLFAVGGFSLWGMAPFYFSYLYGIPPIEVIAHRILWTLVVALFYLTLQQRWGDLKRMLASKRQLGRHLFSGVMVSANWLLFVYAVNVNQVLQSSMGFFIYPLVSVLLGMLFFSERFTARRMAALLLVISGVGFMIVAAGVIPWIALLLGLTMGIYGLSKKSGVAEGAVGLVTETLILSPIALAYVLYLETTGQGAVAPGNWDVLALLFGTGIYTGTSLVLFALGARRLPMSTMGLLQYINPTLQFLTAILILDETLNTQSIVTFALIWAGLILYSVPQRNRARPTGPNP